MQQKRTVRLTSVLLFIRAKKFCSSRWMFAFLIGSSLTASAHPQSYLIGVNQARLMWMQQPDRKAILQSIADHNVGAVRIPLHEPFENVLDAIKIANDMRVPVLICISFNIDDYFSPSELRRKGNYFESSYRLSAIDLKRFKSVFSRFWNLMENNGLKIHALEVGNEINWAFNGDVPIHPGMSGKIYDDIEKMPEKQEYLAGIDKYISIARYVKILRDSSSTNRNTILLSAGLATVSSSLARSSGVDAISPRLFYQLLAQRGVSKLLDAPAIHYYPDITLTPQQRLASLNAIIADCALPRASHKCWVTEWGISNNGKGCSPDDRTRTRMAEEARLGLDEAARNGRIEAIFYFEWFGKTARSVWRCDKLMEAGKIAIRAPSP